ncbi:MAG TPA: solute carrier family 23 protein [Bacilli bacterium]|jgi:NCS2 family nucleobase:cation symporter-2|nr:solute carrier family 23 protein [Bacilli bacterium]HQC32343.1 solute carrier family 23 protein [Bacilli bacterium]
MKRFFASFSAMFANSKTEHLYSVNGRVPLLKAIPFGLQHVLSMFVANITPVIIVFGLFGDPELTAQAVRGAIFMAGIGTIIQVMLGSRLPVVVGTSFTFVSALVAIGNPGSIFGALIVGGLIILVLGIFAKYWRRWIRPVVPAAVVLAIGLSLLSVGSAQFFGGSNYLSQVLSGAASNELLWQYALVAFITLSTAVAWNIFIKGVWKNLAILVAMAVGYLVALLFPGMVNLSLIGSGGIIALPSFIDFSSLRFELVPILIVSISYIASSVECIGDTTTLARMGLGRDPSDREIAGAITADAANSIVGALFGSLPLTTFSQNVGIVAQTKVVNRFTIFIGALFLVIASLFPPIANLLITIPEPVLGGCMLILFGSIAVIGMQMVAEIGFDSKTILVLAISLTLGFGITLVGDFYRVLDTFGFEYLSVIFASPILNMFVISMILSYVIPEKKKKAVITSPGNQAENVSAGEEKQITGK